MEEKKNKMTPKQIRDKIRKDTGISIPIEDINGTIGTVYQNLISLRRKGRLRIMDKEKLARAVSVDIGFRTVRGSLDALEIQIEERNNGIKLDINKKALRNFVNFLVKFYDYDIQNLEEFLSKDRYDDMELPDLEMPEDYEEFEEVEYNEAVDRFLEEEQRGGKGEIEEIEFNQPGEDFEFVERKQELEKILYGMGISCSNLDEMTRTVNFKSKKIDFKKSVFEYIFSHEKEFTVSNFKRACETVADLSFGLGKYRNDFMLLFLVGQDLDGTESKTFRGNKEEDKFIEELLYKGITIISIGDRIPPITNMQLFMKYIKEYPEDIAISGMTYTDFDSIFAKEISEDPEFANAMLKNISKNIFERKVVKGNNEVENFENNFGVKIFSYDIQNGRITRNDIEDAIVNGKATIKIVNLSLAKERIGQLKNVHLKEIFYNLIREKEAVKDENVIEQVHMMEENEVIEEVQATTMERTNQIIETAQEIHEESVEEHDDPHIAFDTIDDSEIAMRNMLITLQKEYGSDYAILAMQLYASKQDSKLFPTTEEAIEFKEHNNGKEIQNTIVHSFVKKVLRKMRDGELGNSNSLEENYLEKLIVELYENDNKKHEDEFIIESIAEKINEYLENGSKIESIPNSKNATRVACIDPKKIYYIMVSAELEELSKEVDENGNPLITNNEIDENVRNFLIQRGKIDLNEQIFISEMAETYRKANPIQQSTIGANLYASLSQNGREKNAEIARMVVEHRKMIERIDRVRLKRLCMIEKIISNNESKDSSQNQQEISATEEELNRLVEEYTQYIEENYNGYPRGRVIADYESRIEVIKGIDAYNERLPGKSMRYMAKEGKRAEVVDID